MKSNLRKLYRGEIFPAEEIVPRDEDYRPLGRKISDEKKHWQDRLSKEEYEWLEDKLVDLRLEMCSMESEESFIYGFRLGSMIMMEVLQEEKVS